MKWLDGMCFGHMKDGEVEGLEVGGGAAGSSDGEVSQILEG